MPAPADLSSVLGSGPAPAAPPAGEAPTDYFTDPLAGVEPSPDDESAEPVSDDPDMQLCQTLWPEWTPEQHQGLLDLIDSRTGGEKPGDKMDDMEPDADQDEG